MTPGWDLDGSPDDTRNVYAASVKAGTCSDYQRQCVDHATLEADSADHLHSSPMLHVVATSDEENPFDHDFGLA